MKLGRLHITAFVAIAAAVWLAVLRLQHTPVSLAHARPFGTVVTALVVIGLLLEFVLWRQRWLHGWFVKRPDLRGTWRVELKSNFPPPEGSDPNPTVGFMGVTQTLSGLQMHLMTPESESRLISESIRPSPNGHGYQVIGVYTNEPSVHLRAERISEMHQGALIVESHGPSLRPSTLTAKYWTDRGTTGTMEFTARLDEVHTRYRDAQVAFST